MIPMLYFCTSAKTEPEQSNYSHTFKKVEWNIWNTSAEKLCLFSGSFLKTLKCIPHFFLALAALKLGQWWNSPLDRQCQVLLHHLDHFKRQNMQNSLSLFIYFMNKTMHSVTWGNRAPDIFKKKQKQKLENYTDNGNSYKSHSSLIPL